MNSVIALFYYAGVAREMWIEPVARRRPHARSGCRRRSRSRSASPLVATVAFGVFPGLVAHFGDVATDLVAAVGR